MNVLIAAHSFFCVCVDVSLVQQLFHPECFLSRCVTADGSCCELPSLLAGCFEVVVENQRWNVVLNLFGGIHTTCLTRHWDKPEELKCRAIWADSFSYRLWIQSLPASHRNMLWLELWVGKSNMSSRLRRIAIHIFNRTRRRDTLLIRC